MTIELVPLCTVTIQLRDPFILNDTPVGGRWIFEVASGTVEGDRLRGVVKGQANADWAAIGADGTAVLDVRALLETHDGALVFAQYSGRLDLANPGTVYVAPRFETGDDRYRWLNKIQAVGKGSLDGQTLVYEWCEVR